MARMLLVVEMSFCGIPGQVGAKSNVKDKLIQALIKIETECKNKFSADVIIWSLSLKSFHRVTQMV